MLLLLSCMPQLAAQSSVSHFEMNEQCQLAFSEIMAMRVDYAQNLIDEERGNNEGNLIPLLLEDYIDFLVVFSTENEQVFEQILVRKEERLRLIKSIGDKKSPYYRYAQAEILLHSAVNRLKFEQYFKCFMEVRKAYRLLEDNHAAFPDFYPNWKSLGLIHALIGTVPDKYKWGVSMLGMDGEVEQGLRELSAFTKRSKQEGGLFYEEGHPIYIFLLVLLGEQHEQAWHLAQQLPTDAHLLNSFVAADVAFRTGHTPEALRYLQARPRTMDYLALPLLDYLEGIFLLADLSPNADEPLLRFLRDFEGQHYIKDAHLKLSWFYHLNNEEAPKSKHQRLCLIEGVAVMDLDKQAQKEVRDDPNPNKELLKARLLFDGHYLNRALTVLKGVDEQALNTNDQLEYTYRLARVNEGLGNEQAAISAYLRTVNTEGESFSYFAPKSCLQLGKIHERNGNYQEAKTYFNRCFEFKNYEYESSIEQQAKAGLSRIRSKQ